VNEAPLHINNVFWTFQGEGAQAGRRALFVRMPFCNLACSWCDTEFNSFKKWSEREFLDAASSEKGRFAVLTGGEPMMNKHSPRVVNLLKSLGFWIACESNGTFPPIDGIDFITVSPKRDAIQGPYYVNPEMFGKVSEFKYVVDRYFDFSILERHNTPSVTLPRLSLSPEFGEMKENLDKIASYVADHPWWRISVQTHKWMGIP
jgi:7-carboxy-7-deazaguanine synthase